MYYVQLYVQLFVLSALFALVTRYLSIIIQTRLRTPDSLDSDTMYSDHSSKYSVLSTENRVAIEYSSVYSQSTFVDSESFWKSIKRMLNYSSRFLNKTTKLLQRTLQRSKKNTNY